MQNSENSNQNNTQNNDNDIRIIELAEQIERLSIELNRRISIAAEDIQSSNIQANIPTATRVTETIIAPTETNQQFRIGDTVEITNNYKGNFGKQGKIVKITKTQVAIKFPNSNSRVYKKKTNIKLVQQHE
jgi:hypothetical protein